MTISNIKISIITPTANREIFMPALYWVFNEQTYNNKELLVHDNSDNESEFFRSISDERVRYFHDNRPMTIGEKRNFLVEQAMGDMVVCFDDDDYYSPIYLDYITNTIGAYDAIKLCSWFSYTLRDRNLYYWDTSYVSNMHLRVAPNTVEPIPGGKLPKNFIDSNVNGYGFSLAFKKSCSTVKYKNMNHGEDYEYVKQLISNSKKILYVSDKTGLALHNLHGANTSIIYPQYNLPNFMLHKIFPAINGYFAKIQA